MSSAPPAAWTTRATTSTQTSGATAQAAEARAKTTTPARNAVRRPIRSAARPAGTSSAANTIAYAFSTQDSDARSAPPNVRPIDGSATLTMNMSRFTIAMPAVTTANTAAKRAPPGLTVALPLAVLVSVTRPPVAIARATCQPQRASNTSLKTQPKRNPSEFDFATEYACSMREELPGRPARWRPP